MLSADCTKHPNQLSDPCDPTHQGAKQDDYWRQEVLVAAGNTIHAEAWTAGCYANPDKSTMSDVSPTPVYCV